VIEFHLRKKQTNKRKRQTDQIKTGNLRSAATKNKCLTDKVRQVSKKFQIFQRKSKGAFLTFTTVEK
jgi:hypothetical protein